MSDEIELRSPDGNEIDLRDRLRFAADSLAADFRGELSAAKAEALVFSSAEGLLASASVTDFVPILAERRARLAVRSGRATASEATSPGPAPCAPAPTQSRPPAPRESRPPVPALTAVPAEDLRRLRAGVEKLRAQVSGWQAELSRR